MVTKRILATSGGFIAGPIQRTVRIGEMLTEALAMTGKTRPRVCLVLTASGDDSSYYAMLYEVFNAAGCDVTELKVFPQPSANPEERLTSSDFVWVGGGSVANLLELWRLHNVDDGMRAAWESGVILGGVSAGSLCWHTGGTTDSYGPLLKPVTNGLGLLPYANGVHYDSEEQRRPLLHKLVGDQTLAATAFATDDHVGIWYENTTPTSVVTDSRESWPNAKAYLVKKIGNEVRESELALGTLSAAVLSQNS
jgi:peptidase E